MGLKYVYVICLYIGVKIERISYRVVVVVVVVIESTKESVCLFLLVNTIIIAVPFVSS